MTLIQRQDALVSILERFYRKNQERRGGRHAGIDSDIIARAARAKHMHIRLMKAAGYSQSEASASAAQCADVAWLNVLAGAA